MAEDKALTAGKFSALSRGWSEREYRDPSGFMRRRAAMVREWGTVLRPGDRVLELGCGDGALSCVLASEGFEVTGVDISKGMIEEARRRVRSTPLLNGTSYQLVMNHDYDLLNWKVWYGLLGHLRRTTETRTAAELASMCLGGDGGR